MATAAAAPAAAEAEEASPKPPDDGAPEDKAEPPAEANASVVLPGDGESGPKPVLLGRERSEPGARKHGGVLSGTAGLGEDLRHGGTGQTLSCRAVVALHCTFALTGLLAGFFAVFVDVPVCQSLFGPAGELGRPSLRQCHAASGLYQMPWLFRLLYAVFLDRIGFMGTRRRGWIVFGWTVALLLVLALAFLADGMAAEGRFQAYTLVVMTICAFYMISDVAASGMVIEVTRLEGDETKGFVLATSQMVQNLAAFTSNLIGVLAMNSRSYYTNVDEEMTFSFGLGFGQVHAVLAALALPFFVLLAFWLRDAPREEALQPETYVEAMRSLWSWTKTKAAFLLVVLGLIYVSVACMPSPADEVLIGIARPTALQRKVGRAAGTLSFVLGVWLCRALFLTGRWRAALACCLLLKSLLDGGLGLLTAYRADFGPHSWLHALAGAVPHATLGLAHVLTLLVVAEIAPEGSEATAYELTSAVQHAAAHLGASLQSGLAAALALDDAGAAGASVDGSRIAGAACLTFGVRAAGALLSAALLPPGRPACREWLADERWHRRAVGTSTVVVAATAICFSAVASFVGMSPDEDCLQTVGGSGC